MLNIINYIVRIAIIAIGVVFVSGVIVPGNGDIVLMRVMGIVFILFGLYRLAMYRMKSRQYKFMKEEREDEDDR